MSLRRGFTLIELIVVLAIVLVLLGLLLPGVQKVRHAAQRLKCASNLKQLALASHQYHHDHRAFPPGVQQQQYPTAPKFRGYTLFAYLLPYLEQDSLHQQWDFSDPLSNNAGGAAARSAKVLPLLVCPADGVLQNPITTSSGLVHGITSYGGNGGRRSFDPTLATTDGLFHSTGPGSQPLPNQLPVILADVRDGTSHTLFFGERAHDDANYDSYVPTGWPEGPISQLGAWGRSQGRQAIGDVTMSAFVPINYRLAVPWGSPGGATTQAQFRTLEAQRVCAWGSQHNRGVNFAFVDGSVRFLRETTPLSTLKALSTRKGEEPVFID